jgi:hypothetical protein
MKLPSIRDIRVLSLPRFARDGGQLVAVEGETEHAPFPIARTFTVRAPGGSVRGQHAHRKCSQLMICSYGAIRVDCSDGAASTSFVLDRGDCGLLVPPGIWASETFQAPESVLLVLCDRSFEEADYIRDLSSFRAWRDSHAT